MGKFIANCIFILIGLVTANIASGFLFGILLSIGGNIKQLGVDKLAFDPVITIAYMILYYCIIQIFVPSRTAQLYLFLLTLFLSFVANFIQGGLFLIVFCMLLRKMNKI